MFFPDADPEDFRTRHDAGKSLLLLAERVTAQQSPVTLSCSSWSEARFDRTNRTSIVLQSCSK
jgi:hypothetical protein